MLERHASRTIKRIDCARRSSRPHDFASSGFKGLDRFGFERRLGLVFGPAAVDHTKPIRMSECRDRLAQRTGWKHSTVAQPSCAVDTHEIKITREAMMLESIVEDEDLRVED